ncbi:MAG TPA: formyltransferase family protein [Tepidisphaeraceae bacterium]|nr:formyltransferase family protein [Tepidisphaeraceae bacterium]
MHRFTILISGGGGLMRRVASASREPGAAFAVDRVVASRADCGGLERARALGISIAVATPREVWSAVESGGAPDTVLMLGWLPLIDIPTRWAGRVINIHPSLLPKFGGRGMWGTHVHDAVLKSGERVSGFTFHVATNEYDAGPILHQERVHVLKDDTVQMLQARVVEAQHRAIIPFLNRWVTTRGKAAA